MLKILRVAIATTCLLLLAAGPAQARKPKPSLAILGWTTEPIGTTPQVKNGGTIDTCVDTANGQRNLFAVYKGKGIPKKTKVGVAVWGGPSNAGMTEEPSDADVVKKAFGWPVGPKKSYTSRYGFSFAKGPFGPQNINGPWNAKITLKNKVVKRSTVTVAC